MRHQRRLPLHCERTRCVSLLPSPKHCTRISFDLHTNSCRVRCTIVAKGPSIYQGEAPEVSEGSFEGGSGVPASEASGNSQY